MTLFVPQGCRGVVSMDGVIRLRRILLPIDYEPDAQEAVIRAVRTAEAFGDQPVEMVMLHVKRRRAAAGRSPRKPGVRMERAPPRGRCCGGHSRRCAGSRFIVMATEGRHGVFDAVRGSVTEQVVRGAPCPVFAVPAA